MQGRGDWIPPYLVDMTNDGSGKPESEYTGGRTVYGGSELGEIYFVTPTGAAATMLAGCSGSATLPAESDPACDPAGSQAVQSYRHSHYDNHRAGVTADAEWRTDLGAIDNNVRSGVWLEKYQRSVTRDWHRLLNVGSNIAFDHVPYWLQFKDNYDTDERMYDVEDVMRYGNFAWRMGVKQFFVDQTRDRRIGDSEHAESDSHSDPLFSACLTWTTPVQGLEAFAGYSQNFAAIPSGVLGEIDPVALSLVKPETADNIELGLRMSRWTLTGSVTVYDIRFDNRILYVPKTFVSGIDYLGESDGVYENFGGVHARGVEEALGYAGQRRLHLQQGDLPGQRRHRPRHGTGDHPRLAGDQAATQHAGGLGRLAGPGLGVRHLRALPRQALPGRRGRQRQRVHRRTAHGRADPDAGYVIAQPACCALAGGLVTLASSFRPDLPMPTP